jgi:crotonobetainyl-CoA:carnitine CoA-transferase CaiB-like acyl-CoA transferase
MEQAATTGEPAGLFDDISVVELGQYIAAPYCAELLAHGGADVVSIEPVDGGPTRHNAALGPSGEGRHYVIKARGKRAIQLRLSTEEGLAMVKGLVAKADVVITNLRPGRADELGLGWDQLARQHPGLIYAEVRGFGDAGPLADEACVDIVAQATSGLMRSLGHREDGRAAPSDVMIADFTAGSLLAFGVAAALRHRDRTGVGQRVSTSLMAAAFTAQHRRANRFDHVDRWHDELIERASGHGGEPPADIEQLAAWRKEQIGVAPFFYNCFAVADGEVAVGAVAANGPHLLTIAGIDPADLEAPARLAGLTVGETTDLVAARLSDHQADDLVARLRAAGVPAGRVRFLEEAMADPDLHAAELFHTFDHPRLGPTTLPAPPVRFSAVDYRPGNDTPAFGAHTDQLLADLGYDQATIDRLVADGIVARAD